MKKTIRNKNTKGQRHGYQEWYWDNELSYRGNFKNGRLIGYSESHNAEQTKFYII